MGTKCVKLPCPPAQQVSCSFHIFPMQRTRGRTQQRCSTWLTLWKCRTLVRFRHQNYLVRFRKRLTWFGLGKDSRHEPQFLGWMSCVWPMQPPHLLHLQTLSLFDLLTDDKKRGAGTKHWQAKNTDNLCSHTRIYRLHFVIISRHSVILVWVEWLDSGIVESWSDRKV